MKCMYLKYNISQYKTGCKLYKQIKILAKETIEKTKFGRHDMEKPYLIKKCVLDNVKGPLFLPF